jgi:DNA-binding transcriptional MerR regulator
MVEEGLFVELTIEDVAERAGVDVSYVHRLMDLGVVGPPGDDGYREQDAHVTALLHMWEEAGLTAESILAAARSGQLSLDFLESPGWELPPRLDRTYRQLAEERSMPVDLLQTIQRSMGFVPPNPEDLARPDDAVIADLARSVLDIGGTEDAIRRLFRAYIADLAESGDVLTTEETMQQVEADEIEWTLVGPAELHGVATPVTLYRAFSSRG